MFSIIKCALIIFTWSSYHTSSHYFYKFTETKGDRHRDLISSRREIIIRFIWYTLVSVYEIIRCVPSNQGKLCERERRKNLEMKLIVSFLSFFLFLFSLFMYQHQIYINDVHPSPSQMINYDKYFNVCVWF